MLRAHAAFMVIALAASTAAAELTGELKMNPLRVGSTALIGMDQHMAWVLAQASEAGPSVTVEISSADDGLPLPNGAAPDRARFVAIRGHVVADTQVFDASGKPDATRAHTPVWIVAGRAGGGDTLVEVKRSLEGPSRWISSSLVRIGGDWLGTRIGETLAPVFGSTSGARRARTFHPDGSVWEAEVTSLAPEGPYRAAGLRLGGAAIVRMGAGLFKHGQLESIPDMLSLAVRFKARAAPGTLSHGAAPGDQDLFLTAETDRFSDFFNPVVPLWSAEEHDYFANTYHPAQKFLLQGTGQTVWVRLVPVLEGEDLSKDAHYLSLAASQMFEAGQFEEGMKLAEEAQRKRKESNPRDRERKLEERVKAGTARFRLEVQEQASALRRWSGLTLGFTKHFFAKPWTALAEIRLVRARTDLDQEAMRYHPDLAGRGLVPVGVVPSIRPAVYRASQDARPATAAEREGITGVVEVVEPRRD